jgi:CheY-like chemotaxis protein/HPt (histidine-containing phosphotransfer) domain-containing protein
VKFTDRGGVLIKASYDAAAERLRVEVIDSGIGIPKHKLSSLFERFTQADASITRRFGGTGLGLAISKRLVALMGGKIGVESEEGQGAKFWFELPLKPGLEASEPAMIARSSPGNALNLLLAEDNRVNQEIIQKMREQRGHRVTVVDTGLDALRTLRNARDFDVILMDVQMPVMDGLTATASIREDEAREGLSPIPIIGLTANAMMEDVKRCVAAGMQGHVAKPVEWDKLFAALDQFVGNAERQNIPASPEATAARAGVLDESTLNQLSSLMGSPSLVRLLTIFADELQSVAAELDLISTADLARRCHKLKSSAGQLGFKELSGLCEIAAKEARDTTVRVENRDLRSGLARAIEVARSLAEGGSRQSPLQLAS